MENKKIAILQSNYIPWKGYFDIINSVDEFILADEMQYTKNEWRNRNTIKTQNEDSSAHVAKTRQNVAQVKCNR